MIKTSGVAIQLVHMVVCKTSASVKVSVIMTVIITVKKSISGHGVRSVDG